MDIHTYFGLSYSNYLVIPPKIGEQASPDDLAQLKTFIQQLHEAFPQSPAVERVALRGQEWEIGDLSEGEMAAYGVTTNLDDLHEDCECGPEPEPQADETDAAFAQRHYAWQVDRDNHEIDEQQWYYRGDTFTYYSDLVVLPEESVEQAREANRLVLPRTWLQSMPEDWQERFVALAGRLGVDEDDDVYEIRVFDTLRRPIADPVPGYNRGRTHLEPRLEALA